MIVTEFYSILNILLLLKVSRAVNAVGDNKQQPEIKSDDRKLLICSVPSRNITFRMKGDGGLFFNSVNILNLVKSKKVAQLHPIEEKEEVLTAQSLRPLLESFKDDLRILGSRFAILQNRTRGRTQTLNIRRSLGRIRQVLNRAIHIEHNLIINECQDVGGNGTRCKNGGNCYDGYKDFHCECPNGWTGKTCEEDIDECYLLAGTDLGCQNNADCINTLGSYSCSCHTGFYGSHCKLRKFACGYASREEICGHGTCVNANNDAGIVCICDQGWTKNQVVPEAACNIDVNECDEATNPCHGECINLPGSFECSPCPSGYTGNGVFCTDIDECAVNNGGCSMQPKVSCINTEGSYHCGDCPTGWEGDGRICESTALESCESKDICYRSAKCDYISNTVVCTCPSGMYGHGFGIDGCSALPLTNPCKNHNCQNNATCEVLGSGTRCICSIGYMGPTCAEPDACNSKPCHNGGTCTMHINNTYRCACPRGTTGPNCEIVRDICGSIIRELSGSITYPPDGGTYLPNERCAWLIRSADSLVLNIKFSRFDLETATDCNKDWLQLHDGRSLASRLIGRFCGVSLPLGGNIQTSQSALFFWFRSDNESNGAGFNLSWTSVAPTCGGKIDLEGDVNGIIRSPGYPGKAPPNTECEWQFNAPFGYRFLLRFFEINLGGTKENNCTRDTLKIFDSDQLLRFVCETSLIEPMHSSSNTINLHLHTDNVGTDSSFQLHYEVVPSAPNCGGVFTERSGIITGYINGRICSYLIKQPIDTKVKLDFTDFNLLKSEGCAIQKVEVYDGSTDENNLLKRLCGNQTGLEPITSTSNSILIRYEYLLPGVILPKKYEIKYERVCESEIVSADNGIFTTPNYPNPYLEHLDCTFTIRGPINTVVHINFTDFSISKSKENSELANNSTTTLSTRNKSFVDVYLSKNDKLRYNDGTFLHLISEKNFIQVVFHGGSNNEAARGIRVEYEFQEMKCGGILTGESGQFSHDAMTGPSEENCEWVIEVPRGKHIQLDLSFLRLLFFKCISNEMDISIYSNNTPTEGQLLTSFCQTSKRIRESFYTNTMTVILHMRRNRPAKVELSVGYEVVDDNKVCGGKFSTRYGVVKTPYWPNTYDDFMNCTWIISAPIGHKIELVIRNFSLEAVSGNCNSDYLEIRNGDSMESPLIGKYCGRYIPARIPSFTNHLYLHFVSDSFISDTGFYISWEQTETGCGGKLNSHKGSIHSPHNVDVNGGTVSCDWQIIISRGSVINMKIKSTEDSICNQNLLTVYDGLTVDSTKFKFECDGDSNEVQLKTSLNQALIVYNFAQGEEQNSLKFFIDYEADCNVSLDNIQGVIESLNFPDTYPAGLNCFWDIHGGQNNKFQLVFSHLDIELRDGSCDYDYIDIFDFHNDDILSKQRLCSNPRKPIITEGNRFQIKFSTDYSVHATGFRMEYKRIGCGEHLTGNIGVIKSPNAPYSTGLSCDWDIEVGAGKIIVLNFDVIHIETEQGDCREDGIVVSDKKNSTFYLLKECRIEPIPVTITSVANHLHIHFYTSSTRLRKYIRGTYTTRDSSCGGVFRGNSGRIRYHGDISVTSSECVWMITVENSYGINLVFDNFNTSCSDTFLGLWKIVDSSEYLIEKMCGKVLPASRSIQSNKLRVVYKSSPAGWGNFAFQFKKVCGGFLNDTVGYIKSRLHENCEWKIESNGTQIFLDILHLECDCSNQENCTNSVKLVDGNGKNELYTLCGNHQSNIILPTNSLIVYTSKIEFIAKYSIVQSSCGGIITSMHGILTSPFYPQSYPSNVECVWQIKASAGNSIEIDIDDLDIATSEKCNEDFLEIRQSDESGKIARIYCSNEKETDDLVIFEKAWIKFRSIQGSTGNGFKISWNYAHNNELNTTMGTIESPPLNSIRNQEAFTWRILLPRGNFVFIEFLEYNKGLRLYDGFDETALEVPILESPWQYTSSSHVLYLVSRNNELHSFKIYWRAVNNSVVQTNVSRNDCNNTFVLGYTTRLNISSPGYPYGYANNLECEWTLKPEDPTDHILLSIYEVKLEPFGESDYLRILSSTNLRDWHKELDISDSNDTNMLPVKVIHGTPFLKLVLHTDSNFNRTGFTSIARTICGSNMTGITGQIMVNNIIPWSLNLVCKWQFTVPTGKKVLLRFDYSNKTIPISKPCRQYAVVYDGFDYNAPILSPGHICNQQGHNVKTLESSSNRLTVKYNLNWTNPFERDLDFNLTYLEIGDCDTEVQLTHYLNSVNISSPNYPSVPNPHTDCNWIIIGPVGETLQAEFLDHFSMNTRYCDKEFVEFFDGSTELSRSFGRFCTKPSTIRSTGNILRLHYLSDISEPRNGFRVNVSIASCGGTYTTAAGEISSIGYPTLGAYPKPSVCEYTIKMPDHSRMRLNFSDIDLPYENTDLNKSDRIQIIPLSENEETINLYGNTTLPPLLDLDTNKIVIRFLSFSGNRLHRGFKLTFQRLYGFCFRDVNKDAGILTFNAIGQVPLYVKCKWKIRVPKGQRVTFEFLKFEAQTSANSTERAKASGTKTPADFYVSTASELANAKFSYFLRKNKRQFDCNNNTVNNNKLDKLQNDLNYSNSSYSNSNNNNTNISENNGGNNSNNNNPCAQQQHILDRLHFLQQHFHIQQQQHHQHQHQHQQPLTASTTTPTPPPPLPPSTTTSLTLLCQENDNNIAAASNNTHNNELNTTMGTIESPPLNSIRNQEAFTWRILLPRGNFVFIEFLEYNKGLRLYDGFDETALEVPILESPWQYTSSSHVLYLVSRNNELHSFKIYWRAVNNSVVQTNVSRNDCNNTFVLGYTTRLNISSPGYPYGYANNLECEWTLKPEDPTDHILLSIYEVKLEPFGESDYLRILSSTNLRDWHKELDISDSNDTNMLPVKVIHGTPFLKLVLHTDSNFNRTGFTSIARTICGSNMTGITGQIMVNNIIPWSLNLVCKWQFTVPTGKKVLLRFDYSNKTIPISKPCRQYAVVYDGFDYNAPILSPGHICNQQGHNVKTLESSSNRLTVKYNLNWTNPFERDLDFNLTYLEIGDCDTEVQLTHYLNSVNISSPNYPSVPNPHTDCNWIIIGPVGETLQAEFLDHFSMNTRYCDKEFVEFFDGSTELSRSFGRFCTKPSTIRSTGNILRLHYLSDISEPRNGFRVNVSIASCGGTYTTAAGEISSIGYPTLGAYPKPSVCEYTIKMPDHSRMRLNFSDIDLPYENTDLNKSDRIQIIPLSENEETINLYGNTTLPPLLDLDTNKIVIRFLSFSGNRLHRGFKLTFQRLYGFCFRDVNKDAGILTFNAIGQVPLYVKCKWKIRVPKGQRVTFEFLKFEAQTSANSTERFIQRVNPYRGYLTPKISFYNDPDMLSKITEIYINNFNLSRKIQSSDNYMYVIIDLNRLFTSIRTLKARFSSNDDSYCPPDINDQFTGSIDTNRFPSNTNFFCTSRFDFTAGTITFVINELLINIINTSISHPYAIRFTTGNLVMPYTTLFENTTGLLVSLPSNSGTVNMLQNDNIKISRFAANFYRNFCGGKFNLMDDYKIVFPPENFVHEGSENHIECAWMLTGASESRHFRIMGNVSLFNDCTKEYISIYSGLTSRIQLVTKICHNSTELLSGIGLKKPITIVLYHSSEIKSISRSSFEIKAETSISCGNEIMVRSISPLVSVNSKTYKNNMECTWEFKTYPGLYLSVNFVGRFFIEKSANCSKDYLEVYGHENEIWQPKQRICGRDVPVGYNATSNRMLILFRTDNTTTGDGFTFKISSACTATFNVTDELQTLRTPNIENFRFSDYYCTYTFLTNSDKGINLRINLASKRLVRGPNIFTAYKNDNGNEIKIGDYGDSVEISEKNYLRIVFSSIFDVFQIDYQLNSCGGNITRSAIIRSLSATTSESGGSSVYAGNMNCVWNVMAPIDHSVLIRFKYFDMEKHKNCIFDFVSIYSGSFAREENELVKLCGNLTEDPPLISVDGNRALIRAVSDSSNTRKGFMAEVLFVRNCNERVALTNDEAVVTQPLLMIRNYTVNYMEELHCQIRVTAHESYRVKIQMRSLDINKNENQCKNPTCAHCNYVEVLETIDESSKPLSLGKFCSNNQTKRNLITSAEHALLQFSFTAEGNYTIEIILEIEKSVCGGRNELELRLEKELIIKFPSDDSNYLPNTHCKWRIRSHINYQIYFEYFLVQTPSATTGECVDFLRIGYETVTKTYCGNATGFMFLGNNLRHGEHTDLTFHSDDTIEDKGFTIKISSLRLCNRTHTNLSGSIHFEQHEASKKKCFEEIIVPNDYFINLHMRLFTENQNCSEPNLQINDISSNRKLRSRCISNFFQTHLQTNASAIRIDTISIDSFDLDYFTSPRSAEIGCGGEIYTTKGEISSPNYDHRNFSECRWVITMPEPNHIEIYFTTFDMGSKVNCDFDYLNIIEIFSSEEEKVAKNICGDEYIENFISKTSKIAIVSKKSPNFNGIGWTLKYRISN
ncbi:cubilin homolog [Eurosta solidaginis]|uniref:cubilin homolog n=1 Tax=Eurosta solidaginis TaxID=178769 RepID=UPI0035310988